MEPSGAWAKKDQMGSDDTGDVTVLTQASSAQTWAKVRMCTDSVTAQTTDGAWYGWGDKKQLGLDSTAFAMTPVLITVSATDMQVGQTVSLAQKDTYLYATGDNYYGQLGER